MMALTRALRSASRGGADAIRAPDRDSRLTLPAGGLGDTPSDAYCPIKT